MSGGRLMVQAGGSLVGIQVRDGGASANIQEWRSSAGSILTRISSGGGIFTGQNSGFGGRVTVGSETVQGAARLVALATSATDIPFVARGFASQSANLQEWQNSAGTVLAYMGSGGAFRTPIIQAGNGAETDLRVANSGGQITMLKQTAAASNPSANYARIYFRDGTNANTLKLVVRAGAAGAETTILEIS